MTDIYTRFRHDLLTAGAKAISFETKPIVVASTEVCVKDTLSPVNDFERFERCMNMVSPDDPDKEQCAEHLVLHLHQLERYVSEALNELIRYRNAAER